MDIWLTVLLAWLGVNIVLVALMWRYETMKAHKARRPRAGNTDISEPVAPDVARPRARRVVSLTSADNAAAARGSSASPALAAAHVCAPASLSSCRLHELHDEIRALKLTVAELSLDRAMLSAAAARRKVSP